MKKFQNVASNPKVKKLGAILMCMMICCATLIPMAFAASDMTPNEAATSIFNTVSETVNVSAVVGVIGIALVASLGLFFAWWGIRKVIRMVKGGLNGKLKV